MKEQECSFRDKRVFQYSSAKRYIKFFVPGFAFKHDNSFKGKDKFVGRELQMRRLFLWLTSTSHSGSYLITGYRGMGKSLLVSRVLESICRPQKHWKELIYYVGAICAFLAALFIVIFKIRYQWTPSLIIGLIFGTISILCFCSLYFSKFMSPFKFWAHTLIWRWGHHIKKEHLSKYILKKDDGRDRRYWRVPVYINLGQEVLNERDVLGIIAQNVREKYTQYVRNKQNRPLSSSLFAIGLCIAACLTVNLLLSFLSSPFEGKYIYLTKNFFKFALWYTDVVDYIMVNAALKYGTVVVFTMVVLFLYRWIWMLIRNRLPYISTPFRAIKRLNYLCDRISANVNEGFDVTPELSRNLFSISFGGSGRRKVFPIANVREIEQELQEIINQIGDGRYCPRNYQIQFIIIFDELDKVSGSDEKGDSQKQASSDAPEFDTSIEGFSGTMGFEERKKHVLRLLANMKLFIATVKAKCVFISGHELYDASLADLSDREFAISSIFNGVMNVDSFLSPEREQNEVSSMTEMYLANMLLPQDYVLKKMKQNVKENDVLKEELPSLRWYNEYLLEEMQKDVEGKDNGWLRLREKEIQFAVEFLHHFSIYLAHICNGSPKKISTYFEKYIKTEYDVDRLHEWGDVLSYGKPSEKKSREQCVLWFDSNAQRLINFMFYIASPVMKAITNEVSHYGDKLLVTSSFILDQVYKYHGKGFSWRNLEQMPELLNANKNPELRDSMASMMDFLLQTHITRVPSGIYQYKFHKQIAEEITYISMMSEEASAVFNFTLNESGTVKRYNLRLLDYYLRLTKMAPQDAHYRKVLERLHENIGDIYYMDEDYYCAIHEYRNALGYIEKTDLTPNNVIDFLKCSLKIGMSYEYRHTFENAYMMYCQTINRLIHLRWIDERAIGLDYTTDWTKDWRIKQPMLVDYKALKDRMEPSSSRQIVSTNIFGRKVEAYQEPSEEEIGFGKNYRKQFLSGVWKEIKSNDVRSEYSTKTDEIISGLSSNFTPEKSDILQRLTVFEDVRYIYLAIIAKLFVMEKMELGGVSYSSIEVAEAEFLYLHSATHMQGKYMISADFFHKMAEVMYYKNGYVTPLPNVDSLVSALYFYDCNILGLIDDYCFYACRSNSKKDAVEIKKNIKECIEKISFDEFRRQDGGGLKETIKQLIKNGGADQEKTKDACEYLEYIDKVLLKSIDNRVTKIEHCSLRRSNLLKMGYKLPCNACRYAYRSIEILEKRMFVESEDNLVDNEDRLPVVLRVLRLTSRKHIRHIRQMEMALLANTAEQMGDIMLSCSLTRTKEFDDMSRKQHVSLESFDWEQDYHLQDDISVDAIELLEFLTESSWSEVDRRNRLCEYKDKYFTKIDKSLMFYWAASRFYEMASLFKEASYCMERILKVIQGYLKVVGASAAGRDDCIESIKRLCGSRVLSECSNGEMPNFRLVKNIFRYASKYVGQEFDNYELGEIHEYRWMFHMERMDDVDLSRLSVSTDLKPFLLLAMDIKIRAMEYLRRFDITANNRGMYQHHYRAYIEKIYPRICSPLRHDKTFKEEVLGCFMKAQVNKRILIDCLGYDIVVAEKTKVFGKKSAEGRTDFHEVFYTQLYSYLTQERRDEKIDKSLFGVDNVASRLSLIEYLIQDSFVCLSSILAVLTPHNRLTTFSNFFLAEVYDLMWEWSKCYEWMYDLYLYRKYNKVGDSITMNAILKMLTRNTLASKDKVEEMMRKCLELIKEQVEDKNSYGYQYTRLLMNIRHDVDDDTIHHIFTNVSAQMSTKYYKMAKDINNEGPAYKNMIEGMYVLDDDLRNDTCQSNLADERYLWHCGLIDRNRDMMAGMYAQTSTNRLENYEYGIEDAIPDVAKRIDDRLEDSLYINSEY